LLITFNQFFSWQVESKAVVEKSNTCSLCKHVAKNRSCLRYHLAARHDALREVLPPEVYNSLGLVSWNLSRNETKINYNQESRHFFYQRDLFGPSLLTYNWKRMFKIVTLEIKVQVRLFLSCFISQLVVNIFTTFINN
jgi:hypothetical protein